jgi:hypothetical protein
MLAGQQSGELWFSSTHWEDRPAFRMSVSSWRTSERDIGEAIRVLGGLLRDSFDAGAVRPS